MDTEPLIIIAALVGIVWGAVIFLRGGLLAGGLTVLLAGTVCGFSALHTTGSLPMTSDRILWALLMAQLVVWWRLGLTAARPISRVEVLLLTFIGVLAASVVMHDWTGLPLSEFVFYYLMPAGLYWVGWQARITERGLRAMYVLMAVFGVYLAMTALAEKYELNSLVFPRYIVTPTFTEFLGRSRGPLLNPAANGMLLGLCTGAGLMTWPRLPSWVQPLLIAYAALLCVGIFCTGTRSAWMGGALGLFLLLLLVLPRFYRPWFAAAALLGATVLVTTQWANIVEFKRDKYVTAHDTATSAQLRPTLAWIAWEMFCDRPLMGCGLGHYQDQHKNYLSDRSVDVVLEQGRGYVQHNIWLSLLTETGLIGMTLFALLMIAWLRSAWRLWRASNVPLWMRQAGLLFIVVAANYLANGMFQDMTIIPMVHMILFFLAGVTVNLQTQAAEWQGATGVRLAAGERG